MHISNGIVGFFVPMRENCIQRVWNINVKKNDLSKMFILKFTEPLFATFFSFVIHGENVMNIKYLISVLCTILAIKVSTYERNER